MDETVRLGVATSLSGRYAPFGRQVLEGLRCYKRDVDRRGGLRRGPGHRVPVELRIEDDRSDPDALRDRLRHLVLEQGVHVLFGPYGSGLSLAAAAAAEQLGVVVWNHSGAADGIHDRHPGSGIGILSPASTYLETVLDLVEALGPPVRRVALVQAGTGFGAELALGVLRWTDRHDCSLVHRVCRSGDADSIEAAVGESVAQPVDVVLGAGRFEDDVVVAEVLWRVRPDVRAVGLVAAGIDRFAETFRERAEGFLAPSQWDRRAEIPVDFGPTTEEFVKSYRSGTDLPLDYPAAQSYAAALVAEWCLERAASLDPRDLRETAARARLTTFYGRFGIDPATGRQREHEMLVTRWREGDREVLWPRRMAGSPAPRLAAPWAS